MADATSKSNPIRNLKSKLQKKHAAARGPGMAPFLACRGKYLALAGVVSHSAESEYGSIYWIGESEEASKLTAINERCWALMADRLPHEDLPATLERLFPTLSDTMRAHLYKRDIAPLLAAELAILETLTEEIP